MGSLLSSDERSEPLTELRPAFAMTGRGWILLGLVGLIWGIPYLLIKIAVADVSPPTLVLARTGVGAVVLLPFALRTGGLHALRGRWPAVAAFAALEIVGPWFLLSNAERTLPSSTTGLLVATVPILAVVLGRVSGDRRPITAMRWSGLLIGLGGVALLVGPGAIGGETWPVLQVLLAAVGYASAPLIAERALAGVPAVTLTAACLSMAALVYAPVVLLTGPHPMPGAKALLSLAALGIVCTALAFVLFFLLIREAGAVRSTVVAYINPLVAVVLGAVVLSERLTVLVVVATVLIIGGSVAASRRAAGDAGDARTRTTTEPPSSDPTPATDEVAPT